MASSDLYTVNGQAYAMLVSAGNVTGPLTITGNPLPDACYLLNPSNTSVAVTFQQVTASVPPSGFRFPINGSPSIAIKTVVLPPLMQFPLQFSVPQGGFSLFAVAVSQVTATIYAMPSSLQT